MKTTIAPPGQPTTTTTITQPLAAKTSPTTTETKGTRCPLATRPIAGVAAASLRIRWKPPTASRRRRRRRLRRRSRGSPSVSRMRTKLAAHSPPPTPRRRGRVRVAKPSAVKCGATCNNEISAPSSTVVFDLSVE